MKNLFVVCITIMLLGCYEKGDDSNTFSWAVADKSVIHSDLMIRAKRLNPYEESYSADRNTVRREIRSIKRQIDDLRKTQQTRCFPDSSNTKKEYKYSMNECTNQFRDNPNKIKDDSLIIGLNAKAAQLEEVLRLQQAHDSKIKEHVLKHIGYLIAQHANGKYEVVIDKSKQDVFYNPNGIQNILYNRSAVELDVTQAIISDVEDADLKLDGAPK